MTDPPLEITAFLKLIRDALEAYKLLGRTDDWKKYLEETKEKHKRKPALQNQLARL